MKNDFYKLFDYMQIGDYYTACKGLHTVGNEEELRVWLKEHVNISEAIKEEAARIVQQAYTDEEAGYIRAIKEKNRDSGVKESVFDIRKRKLAMDLDYERESRFLLWDKLFKEAAKKLAVSWEEFKNVRTVEDFQNWLNKNMRYKDCIEENFDFNKKVDVIGDALAADLRFVNGLISNEEEGSGTDAES